MQLELDLTSRPNWVAVRNMDWPIELHALNDLDGALPVSDFECLTVGHGSKSKSVSPL